MIDSSSTSTNSSLMTRAVTGRGLALTFLVIDSFVAVDSFVIVIVVVVVVVVVDSPSFVAVDSLVVGALFVVARGGVVRIVRTR